MKLTDGEYKEIHACFDLKDIPKNPAIARQAIENFVDLVELLMRPLPPPGGSSFKQLP